jgi:glycine/D-amino acid oxidase-like deaminating enzyme
MQVTPLELTEKLVAAATALQIDDSNAVEVLIDSVIGIERQSTPASGKGSDHQVVTGVRTRDHGVIAADRVVICMGPWSGKGSQYHHNYMNRRFAKYITLRVQLSCATGVAVEDWLGLTLPMEGIKSSSIVFSHVPAVKDEPFACFCGEDAHQCHLELYPRPNG